MAALDESGWVAILTAVQDHALTTGLFDQVNGHEPKSPPGNGLTAAIWIARIRPVNSSGLAATSGVLDVNVRVQTRLSEPQDAIETHLLAAVNELMIGYSADFTLGGQVREVDLLGMEGIPLAATAGYLTQAEVTYRVMTITLPLVINDLWSQSP